MPIDNCTGLMAPDTLMRDNIAQAKSETPVSPENHTLSNENQESLLIALSRRSRENARLIKNSNDTQARMDHDNTFNSFSDWIKAL